MEVNHQCDESINCYLPGFKDFPHDLLNNLNNIKNLLDFQLKHVKINIIYAN